MRSVLSVTPAGVCFWSQVILADLLVSLRGDEHFDAGLVHIVDVGPVSLDLRVLDTTGQTVNGPRRPERKRLYWSIYTAIYNPDGH